MEESGRYRWADKGVRDGGQEQEIEPETDEAEGEDRWWMMLICCSSVH